MSADLMLGAFALTFGLVTLVARFVAPDSRLFSKLGAMKERFGERAGTVIHVFAYTVMPLLLGSILVAQSLLGGR